MFLSASYGGTMRMMMIVMISRRIASLWIVLLLISSFSYHYIATGMSSTITAEDCSNFDMAQLYFKANEVAKKADDYLSPYFRSIYEGQWRVALDEKQGLRNGGFTNTFGSYGTTFFNSSEILPAGICDIPMYEGDSRCSAKGLTDTFLLGAIDVIAFILCTPPPVRYFAHDMILSARLTEDYPFYPGVYFGDTISFREISDALLSNEESLDVFNQPVVILQSMDALAADKVRSAYIAAGMDSRSIFIREVSSQVVRAWDRSHRKPWQASDPDILRIISRIAIPLDGSLLEYYNYKKTVWPARFYMADDDYSPKASVPYDPPLRPRFDVTVKNEIVQLSHNFHLLVRSCFRDFIINRKARFRITEHVNLTSYGLYDDWVHVLAQKNNDTRNAEGTRDSTYGLPILSKPTGEYLVHPGTLAVVIGVVHSKFIGCAYSSVCIDIRSEIGFDTHCILDSDLIGSADRYLMSPSTSEYLFAIDIRPSEECITITNTSSSSSSSSTSSSSSDYRNPLWCVGYNSTTIDLVPSTILIGERIYSGNVTYVGPSANTTISTRLLIFDA